MNGLLPFATWRRILPLLVAIAAVGGVLATPSVMTHVTGADESLTDPTRPLRVSTMSLGAVNAPKEDVQASYGQPPGVPLAKSAALDGLSSPTTPYSLRKTVQYTREFSAVGVSWSATPDAIVSVSMRTIPKGSDGYPWSDWAAVDDSTGEEPDESPGRGSPARDGAELLWTGPSVGIDVVVTSIAGTEPSDIKIDLIDPGVRIADNAASTPVNPKTAVNAPPMAAPKGKAPNVSIAGRSAWGANEKFRTWNPEYAPKVSAAVIHHTATSNNYTPQQVPGILRSIYYYQAVTRKWGDIGYNVLIDRFGRAWEGRYGGLDKATIGAHATGFNTGTVGIALIGNFMSQEPAKAAKETAAAVIAKKFKPSGVNPKSTVKIFGGPSPKFTKKATVSVPAVMGHNVVGKTSCPGVKLDAALPKLRERAAQLMKA